LVCPNNLSCPTRSKSSFKETSFHYNFEVWVEICSPYSFR